MRILTIVENTTEKGNIEYTVNGTLPLEEAARALVVFAFNARELEQESKPKKE